MPPKRKAEAEVEEVEEVVEEKVHLHDNEVKCIKSRIDSYDEDCDKGLEQYAIAKKKARMLKTEFENCQSLWNDVEQLKVRSG